MSDLVVAYRYRIDGKDFWVSQRNAKRSASNLKEIREMTRDELLDLQLAPQHGQDND